MVKSAVKVVVRTRPTANFAQKNVEVKEKQKNIRLFLPKKGISSYVDNQKELFSFKFDEVLHNTSQEAVYDTCSEGVVDSVLSGFNSTLMCYGQTGAGKTFTMTGATNNYKQRGIIPRIICELFDEIGDRQENIFSVKISYFEIYMESLYDLLDVDNQHNNLTIMEDKRGNTFVRGISQIKVNNVEEALSMMFEGETNRVIREHQMNKCSSRSHCIFTVYIESQSRVESDGQITYSKLNLVDLAGSERVGKTLSTGRVLDEAKYINKSLSFLEQVVLALSNPNWLHIPYRQSKLTYFLKDSLGGNCKTLMIANIWCEKQYIDETSSTLKFATRMMKVSNDYHMNVQVSPDALIKKYEKQIKELKQELSMHDQLKGIKNIDYDPYTEEQKAVLKNEIMEFIDDKRTDIEVKSIRHMKEILSQVKIIMKENRNLIENKKEENLIGKTNQSGEKKEINKTNNINDIQEDGVGEEDNQDGFGIGSFVAPNKNLKKNEKKSKKKVLNVKSPIKEEEIKEEEEEEKENGEHEEKKTKTIMNKSEAYELFKIKEGKEVFHLLVENMKQLRQKKIELNKKSKTVNSIKKQIDIIKEKLNQKQILREQNSDFDEDEFDIEYDDEELELIKELKESKVEYKKLYGERKFLKDEIVFVTKASDTTRVKLIQEFEQWYGENYQEEEESKNKMIEEEEEENLDAGEKFEKLEKERITKEDPDSYVFFKAKKNMEHRNSKNRRNL